MTASLRREGPDQLFATAKLTSFSTSPVGKPRSLIVSSMSGVDRINQLDKALCEFALQSLAHKENRYDGECAKDERKIMQPDSEKRSWKDALRHPLLYQSVICPAAMSCMKLNRLKYLAGYGRRIGADGYSGKVCRGYHLRL